MTICNRPRTQVLDVLNRKTALPDDQSCACAIPETVVFNFSNRSIPAWFFTGQDGRVLRKNRCGCPASGAQVLPPTTRHRTSCNSNKILHAFLRGAKGRRCEAVAYLLTRAGEGREDGGGGDRLEVEYFDEVGLREFLHTRADITDGMLQRCVHTGF